VPTETGEALIVLVIFVLPGFITLVFKERTHEVSAPVSQFERFFSAVFYSLLVYVPLAVVAAMAGLSRDDVSEIFRGEKGLWSLTAVAVLAGLVLPALIAYVGSRWGRSDVRLSVLGFLQISAEHRTPSAWDYFFRLEKQALIAVTLRSGEVVAGYYGPKSFAAYSQTKQDLYLEEQWALDPGTYAPTGPIKSSVGTWVPGAEIVQLELYDVGGRQMAIFASDSSEDSETNPSEESNG
jgi:hypothetical protein